ncbi:MAG: hypothetical protein Q8J69_13335 [Sphingobacteriaceae bacterium]|nr:hypothetical protein [Sphingobacteriaceae bacterium]
MKKNWELILAEQQVSGQSIKRFCEERGLSLGVFHYHKKRKKEAGTGSFVEVEGDFGNGHLIEICYPSGVRLKLSGKVPFAELSRLLHV